jgi:hypothetical protein
MTKRLSGIIFKWSFGISSILILGAVYYSLVGTHRWISLIPWVINGLFIWLWVRGRVDEDNRFKRPGKRVKRYI